MCAIDDNRIGVTDTKDNIHTFSELTEHEVIPTFHIKGIKFNSKHFSLEIELNHLYLLLSEESEVEQIDVNEPVEPTLEPTLEPILESEDPEDLELSEYIMKTDDLDQADVHLDNLTIYKIYEFLNTRIKESLIEEIRTIFTSKKIKSRLDFSEVIDDEETEE
jgi:hypothetical protein